MPRILVVVAEALAIGTDPNDAAIEAGVIQARRLNAVVHRQIQTIGGTQGVVGEVELDVGDEQFLMLLLVVQTDGQPLRDHRPVLPGAIADESLHGLVDVSTVGVDLRHGGSREQPALRARPIAGLGLLVVGIEQMVEALVEHAVTGQKGLEQKGLVEPGHMRQVPFRRAGLDPGLQPVVLHHQRLAQALGERSNAAIIIDQAGPETASCLIRRLVE